MKSSVDPLQYKVWNNLGCTEILTGFQTWCFCEIHCWQKIASSPDMITSPPDDVRHPPPLHYSCIIRKWCKHVVSLPGNTDISGWHKTLLGSDMTASGMWTTDPWTTWVCGLLGRGMVQKPQLAHKPKLAKIEPGQHPPLDGIVARSPFYQLHMIHQFSHYFDSVNLVMLIHLSVTSRLDYSNVFYMGWALKTTQKLQLGSACTSLITVRG